MIDNIEVSNYEELIKVESDLIQLEFQKRNISLFDYFLGKIKIFAEVQKLGNVQNKLLRLFQHGENTILLQYSLQINGDKLILSVKRD